MHGTVRGYFSYHTSIYKQNIIQSAISNLLNPELSKNILAPGRLVMSDSIDTRAHEHWEGTFHSQNHVPQPSCGDGAVSNQASLGGMPQLSQIYGQAAPIQILLK
jgi:hypothetical protein